MKHTATEIAVSQEFLRSAVTKQMAFGQRDSKLIPKSEHPMDRFCKNILQNRAWEN